MARPHESVLRAALTRLFTPLVRILLRYGISFGEFSDLAKQVYVSVASEEQEFQPDGRKQTNTRISVLTGLTRKEVLRIKRLPEEGLEEYEKRYNRGARVISGWMRDPRYRDGNGKPISLPYSGGDKSFSELVALHSGDMSTRALLDELLRVGAVRNLKNGNVRLCAKGYVPAMDEQEKLAILGVDTGDLVATIDHNLTHSSQDSRFQLKVSYDHLSRESAEQFKQLSDRKSMELLQEYDSWLAPRDRDLNPELGGEGRFRVAVGIHYIEEVLDAGNEVNEK